MYSAFNIHSIPSFTVLSVLVLNIFANATPTKPLLSAGDVTAEDRRLYHYVPVAVEHDTAELVPAAALFGGALPSMNFDDGKAANNLHHLHNHHNAAVQQPSSALYLLRSPSARNLFVNRASDDSGTFSLVRAYDLQRNDALFGAERPGEERRIKKWSRFEPSIRFF